MTEEQQYEIGRCIFREANDAFFIIDPSDQRIVDVNPAAQRLTDYRRKELLSMKLQDILISTADGELAKILAACQSTSRHTSKSGYTLSSKSGSVRDVHVSACKIHVNGNSLGLVVVRDISELVAAQTELRRHEERFRTLIEKGRDLILLLDAQGVVTYVSPNITRLLGYRPEQVVGRQAVQFVHQNDVSPLEKRIREMLDKPENDCLGVVRFRHQDGYYRIVEFIGQNRLAEPAVASLVFNAHDVTDRVVLPESQEDFQAHLLHTQKLEGLGVLAGGFAHDLNNMLTCILGNTAFARTELGRESSLSEMLREIEEATLGASDLTKQILTFCRRGQSVSQSVDVSEVTRKMSSLIHSTLSKKAQLQMDLAQDLPAIEGDPSQIQQIVLNLLTNASESLGDHAGVIQLRTRLVPAKEAAASEMVTFGDPQSCDYVCIEVVDDGCGMDEETMSRIFDPFFSTKHDGSGLGLSVVYGIVKSNEGLCQVESAPGKGTTFRVLLPCHPN